MRARVRKVYPRATQAQHSRSGFAAQQSECPIPAPSCTTRRRHAAARPLPLQAHERAQLPRHLKLQLFVAGVAHYHRLAVVIAVAGQLP